MASWMLKELSTRDVEELKEAFRLLTLGNTSSDSMKLVPKVDKCGLWMAMAGLEKNASQEIVQRVIKSHLSKNKQDNFSFEEFLAFLTKEELKRDPAETRLKATCQAALERMELEPNQKLDLGVLNRINKQIGNVFRCEELEEIVMCIAGDVTGFTAEELQTFMTAPIEDDKESEDSDDSSSTDQNEKPGQQPPKPADGKLEAQEASPPPHSKELLNAPNMSLDQAVPDAGLLSDSKKIDEEIKAAHTHRQSSDDKGMISNGGVMDDRTKERKKDIFYNQETQHDKRIQREDKRSQEHQ